MSKKFHDTNTFHILYAFYKNKQKSLLSHSPRQSKALLVMKSGSYKRNNTYTISKNIFRTESLTISLKFIYNLVSCSILSKSDQKAIKWDYDCYYKKENGFCFCCCLYSFITEILSVKVAVAAQTEAEYTEKRWKKVMIPMNLL